jgi:hypothetical protein
MKLENVIKIVLSILLLGCLFNMPYGYYQFVRLAGLIGFAVLAYQANQKGNQFEIIIYASLALLFQPFIKIALGRELWNVVDVIVGVGLLISIFALPKKVNNQFSKRIHLIKTPEYDSENLQEVHEFLASFEGPFEFVTSDFEFNTEDFSFLQNKLFPQHNNPISGQEFFTLCQHYRDVFKLEPNDFVVLLTKRKNAMNWFSAKDDLQNIFVNTEEWENYTPINAKYPIAYQAIENVLQSLMKLDLNSVPNQYIHESLLGCMNDLCIDKKQIINKLETINICDDCIQKMQAEKISSDTINQVNQIFSGIRNELLFKKNFKKQIQPVELVIETNKKIILPELNNLEIRLSPLFKTLYIFYLTREDGVKLNELSDFKSDLLSIYRKLSNLAVDDSNVILEARIDDLINPIGESFSQKKSKINKIITDLLGEPLAQFYRIEGTPGEPFKINIDKNLIDIRY